MTIVLEGNGPFCFIKFLLLYLNIPSFLAFGPAKMRAAIFLFCSNLFRVRIIHYYTDLLHWRLWNLVVRVCSYSLSDVMLMVILSLVPEPTCVIQPNCLSTGSWPKRPRTCYQNDQFALIPRDRLVIPGTALSVVRGFTMST